MELRPYDHGLHLEGEEVEHKMMMSYTSSYHIIDNIIDNDMSSSIESDAASAYNNVQLLELRYTCYSHSFNYNCRKIPLPS